MTRVLLTGATGFVGAAIAQRLQSDGRYSISAASRKLIEPTHSISYHHVPTLDASSDWSEALMGCDVVIHAAARVHVMNENALDPLQAFREINVSGTLNLARQAARKGVRRFVFISSIKVLGECTRKDAPFLADSVPAPEDAYGISKAEAESELIALSKETGMEVVIIRPPLVYGVGVKGNFASMAKLLRRGLPLPLGAIHNKRSLVGIDNLVDLIIRCVDHPAAANQIFLVGDGEDLSTTELLRGVGLAMGKPARLIPVPAGMLKLGATLLGKGAMAQRLLGSLQVDISKTCELLDWKPPYSVQEGLRRCFTSEKD